MNRCLIAGFIDKAPKMARGEETVVVQFSIVYRYRTNGKYPSNDYIKCKIFGPKAERLFETLKEGTAIEVMGPLKFSNFMGKDGKKRQDCYVKVNAVSFLGTMSAEEL
jgi:single-stranded DNA-binding protein